MQALAQRTLIWATLSYSGPLLWAQDTGPRLPGTAASQAGSLPRNQPLPEGDTHRGPNQTPEGLEFGSECGDKMSMPGTNAIEPNQKPTTKKYFQVMVQNEFVKKTLSLMETCSTWGLQCPRGAVEPYYSYISPFVC